MMSPARPLLRGSCPPCGPWAPHTAHLPSPSTQDRATALPSLLVAGQSSVGEERRHLGGGWAGQSRPPALSAHLPPGFSGALGAERRPQDPHTHPLTLQLS